VGLLGVIEDISSLIFGEEEEVEAEVIYGELVKVSSAKREVGIEYKQGNQWVREYYKVTEDWDDDDFDDLADALGEEMRFFIRDGELEDFEEP